MPRSVMPLAFGLLITVSGPAVANESLMKLTESWAGIGLAACLTNPTDGLGAVGGYAGLHQYTAVGGSLTVWTLP